MYAFSQRAMPIATAKTAHALTNMAIQGRQGCKLRGRGLARVSTRALDRDFQVTLMVHSHMTASKYRRKSPQTPSAETPIWYVCITCWLHDGLVSLTSTPSGSYSLLGSFMTDARHVTLTNAECCITLDWLS